MKEQQDIPTKKKILPFRKTKNSQYIPILDVFFFQIFSSNQILRVDIDSRVILRIGHAIAHSFSPPIAAVVVSRVRNVQTCLVLSPTSATEYTPSQPTNQPTVVNGRGWLLDRPKSTSALVNKSNIGLPRKLGSADGDRRDSLACSKMITTHPSADAIKCHDFMSSS